jgi:hypothetical protein
MQAWNMPTAAITQIGFPGVAAAKLIRLCMALHWRVSLAWSIAHSGLAQLR